MFKKKEKDIKEEISKEEAVKNKKCANCQKIMPIGTDICDSCGSVDFIGLDGSEVVTSYESTADEKANKEKVDAIEKKNTGVVSQPILNPVSNASPNPSKSGSSKLDEQMANRKKIDTEILEKRKAGKLKIKKNKFKKYMGK